ncbi:MAG: cytochrome c oxidase accessory protein CcoG [Pirellulaceae bacterium]|jgi:cytochrome c oxidase accessory protein FixG|nr:cytochrome c oxidase accessory protein CcoG [Pirellulaceae bacterium]
MNDRQAKLSLPVLSTLESDGTRRWLRPKLSKGVWWHRRRAVAYVLMVIFVVVPYIRMAGKPLIQLDITARKFTIFGYTFLPTDTLLLALAMLGAFIAIVFVTAITGRAWCGWACPQTVYMEYLFRPIDRLFEGTGGKGGKPKQPMSAPRQIARMGVYILLSMFLAHTFLAYFVGTEKLAVWVRSSPLEHPAAFLVMASTTALLAYDFYYFREQTCLIACPYGRLQSVMLDPQSLIVAYDYTRGEPRKKGKHLPEDKAGDCVDCNQCVVVCPTGIDIRDGLQMECINCTQCIDACDDVMDKVGYPRGLIRYSSEDALKKKPPRILRARTAIYALLLIGVVSGLVYALSARHGFDARVIRGKGAPFTSVDRGLISNTFSMRLVNRTDSPQSYALEVLTPKTATLDVFDDSQLELQPGEMSLVPLRVRFPSSLTFGNGNVPLTLLIVDGNQNRHEVSFRLLGPRQ